MSAIWCIDPNSVGLPALPLRIGRASGSASDTSRSVIGPPARRRRICARTLSARPHAVSSRGGQPAALAGQAEHSSLPSPVRRLTPQAERGQPVSDRARAIAHSGRAAGDQPRGALTLAHQQPDRVAGQLASVG